jgi:hypothetical protein
MKKFNLELAIIQALSNYTWRDATDLSCAIYARYNKSIDSARIKEVAHRLSKGSLIQEGATGTAWRSNIREKPPGI